MTPVDPPARRKKAFTCPRCGAFAQQYWEGGRFHVSNTDAPIELATCQVCHQPSLWSDGNMVDPCASAAPLPNVDLPEDVRNDYTEAAAILGQSPRGAAALLRLGLEKLCGEILGAPVENLNDAIGTLVRDRHLNPTIQQMLDIVRVVGNNAVHPGQIDLDDTPETAAELFRLMNLIAEQMITVPRHVAETYAQLPEGAREQIARRDGDTQG
jgi:hypothetical protein